MTRSSDGDRWEAWRLTPRDPLVFRDGREPIPFADRGQLGLPRPSTLAGMVRTSFVEASIGPQTARQLLDIRVRGPWLLRRADEGEKTEVWLPPPADLVWCPTDRPSGAGEPTPKERKRRAYGSFVRGEVLGAESGESVLWPQQTRSLRPVHLPGKKGKDKTRPVPHPLWRLDDVVDWNLGKPRQPRDVAPPEESESLFVSERRIHVALEPGRRTARDGQLFQSRGLRLARDCAIGFEVAVPDGWEPAPGLRTPEEAGAVRLVVLGGEGRPSIREPAPDAALSSSFPRETYRKAIDERATGEARLGLRLQLVTPGVLYEPHGEMGRPGWCPPWIDPTTARGKHPAAPDVLLQLVAVCMPRRHLVISGWNMQWRGDARQRGGGPRRVRRLVPEGTVYFFEIATKPDIGREGRLEACRRLWACSLDGGRIGADAEHHLAAPSADGYGLCIPGIWSDSDGANS
ncbi:MAG: type III-B CRISPR module-associated Cmr3 family protein [Myxococcota bacterium]